MDRLKHSFVLITFCLVLFLPGLAGLPPLDRDEARYAQASKQMLETGDAIDIRFQDRPRYKKPAGAYWLQVGANLALGGPKHDRIWVYRLPSVLAAILAVLLTAAIGRVLFDGRTGVIGGVFLAGSVLLVSEAHQAKTDALLLTSVLGAIWALAHLHRAAGLTDLWRDPEPPPKTAIWLFWAALGAGVLIKGPLAPVVIATTVVALGLVERRWAWLRPLLYGPAMVLAAVIALPWYVAISVVSDGAFLAQAVGRDLVPKLTGGVESHGAWPGYYLALTAVMAWPAMLFLWPAVTGLRQAWAAPSVRFLVAWAAPSFILFELVPTKLPHYVLPVYPALMLLAAAAVSGANDALAARLAGRWAKTVAVVWALIALVLGVLGAGVLLRFGAADGTFGDLGWADGLWAVASLLAGAAAAAAGVICVWRRRDAGGLAAVVVAGAAVVTVLVGGVLPRADALQVSRQLATAVRALGEQRPLAIVGYHEPSAVFLLGTDLALTNGAGAADHLAREGDGLALVEARFDAEFRAALAAHGLTVTRSAEIRGLNYSRGQEVTIAVYARR
ncbi:MAG: glycosyltransferase family 39 protein [Pseudomonadota bacterium]|nr:glycosyltransferase family 39 protein [Pseudomonadota bacterium]